MRLLPFLLGLLVVSLCAPGTPARAGGIPFNAAQVTGTDDAKFHLTWQADGVDHVRVFGGTSPDRIDTSRILADGGARDSVTIGPLEPGKRWYFELLPDQGDKLIIAERGLHLVSAPNFRDVGGYRTADGKWVKMGLVYRSDGIEALSSADLATLSGLGIRLVCDLRTDQERVKGPDRLPQGAEAAVFDVMRDQPAAAHDLMAAMADRDTEQRVLGDGGAERIMISLYRGFAVDPGADAAFRGLLQRLAMPDELPAMFHCSAGKDRSGWAAAILLTLLGVPHDVVMADYLASNDYLRDKNKATLAHMSAKLDPALLEPVFVNEARYLDTATDAVATTYGSFDNYLARGLRLDAATLAQLRRELLAD